MEAIIPVKHINEARTTILDVRNSSSIELEIVHVNLTLMWFQRSLLRRQQIREFCLDSLLNANIIIRSLKVTMLWNERVF